MIEQDVINHLKADWGILPGGVISLGQLLEGSAAAPSERIYPIRATQEQQKDAPYIVYSVSPVMTMFSDLLDRDSIEIQVIDDSYSHAGQILDRIKTLLEINDELRIGGVSTAPIAISSSTFYIYSGIRSGGSEFQDPDTLRWTRIVIYEFAYKKKVA